MAQRFTRPTPNISLCEPPKKARERAERELAVASMARVGMAEELEVSTAECERLRVRG